MNISEVSSLLHRLNKPKAYAINILRENGDIGCQSFAINHSSYNFSISLNGSFLGLPPLRNNSYFIHQKQNGACMLLPESLPINNG